MGRLELGLSSLGIETDFAAGGGGSAESIENALHAEGLVDLDAQLFTGGEVIDEVVESVGVREVTDGAGRRLGR